MPIPSKASAEKIGRLVGVKKQAVTKTDWWIQNRKGEKAEEIGRRRKKHIERAREFERESPDDEE